MGTCVKTALPFRSAGPGGTFIGINSARNRRRPGKLAAQTDRPTICMCKVAIGVFAPSASGMVDFEAATKARLLACDDLPSSREWMTRVRLSFKCSWLRRCEVPTSRAVADHDTRRLASCRRPMWCPDGQREAGVGIPELTERNVDAFRPRELVASRGRDGSRTRPKTLQS